MALLTRNVHVEDDDDDSADCRDKRYWISSFSILLSTVKVAVRKVVRLEGQHRRCQRTMTVFCVVAYICRRPYKSIIRIWLPPINSVAESVLN